MNLRVLSRMLFRRNKGAGKFIRSVLALTFVFIAGGTYASDAYEVVETSLKVGDLKVCLLDKKPRYAIESFDGSAVMLSETDYVDKRRLDKCRAGEAVHVLSIPSNVGVLADINILKGMYVSLDFVGAHPFTYLATVARIGTSKNIVSVRGAYVVGQKISELRGAAFSSSGDAGSAIISPDGRYVAPTGEMNCEKSAYPGVWDIRSNRRVVAAKDACVRLFGK
ncbi:hypothetical protein KDX01_30670 [Burkholderia vietnamiensis]|uniref:hypothetical protein n=1 Tax=Burkholderia vietnamiensis TaxID=60552 RepID=UPI001B96F882|nr:hypothetical protein [Burkholderia vietnamiensis]MBR7977460.1 hypothetical protein [Burkholderia vietnamiensis]